MECQDQKLAVMSIKWNLSYRFIDESFRNSFFRSRAAVDITQPTTYEERRKVAIRSRKELLGDIPFNVDTIDDKVTNLYNSLPTQIYLIGKDGRAVYNPGIGLISFNPDYLESLK